MSTILVTGATGHLGKATVNSLLAKGVNPSQISVLVRSAEKASDLQAQGVNIKIGDYDNPASLVNAFTGIDKLFFISSNDFVNRETQHRNVIQAAKEAGVKHIVYSSAYRNSDSETSNYYAITKDHIMTEKLIEGSGIPYTIMQNAIYADSLPELFGPTVLETGIFMPAGHGKAPFTSRNEMAEVASTILTTDGHVGNKYAIGTAENLTFGEVANIISELSGKAVDYHNPTKEVYLDTVTKAGMPPAFAGLFAQMGEAVSQGELETHRSDLETLLGRKPSSLKTILTKAYSQV